MQFGSPSPRAWRCERDAARHASALARVGILAVACCWSAACGGQRAPRPASHAADTRDAALAQSADASPDAAPAPSAGSAAPTAGDAAALPDAAQAAAPPGTLNVPHTASQPMAAMAGNAAPPTTASGLVPKLTHSDPADGAAAVPATSWLRLDFAPAPTLDTARASQLDCGPGTPEYDVALLGASVVINPRAALQPGAHCVLRWASPPASGQIAFTVAAAGPAARLAYDRNDHSQLTPFPDDFYLRDDASTLSGRRVDVRVPEVDASLRGLFDALLSSTTQLDGMSPLAPFVVPLPAALDPASLPLSAAASLDPLATLGLFDLDPASPTHAQRVAFQAVLRDAADGDGTPSHTLLVFPAVPLRALGHYALVVTNRVLVDASRPLQASDFFGRVATGSAKSADEMRLATTLPSVLAALESTSPPLHVDDIALALGLTVRSLDALPDDLLAIRRALQALPPANFVVDSASADSTAGSDVAAIVHGSWSPVSFRNGDFVARDILSPSARGGARLGVPRAVGFANVPFTLALPKSAQKTPAPLIVYQHGQPGSAEDEVPRIAAGGLAAAGFAVIGFTDLVNREIITNGDIASLDAQTVLKLLLERDLPDYLSLLTHAEQLAFLRMLPTLGKLDVLPLGAADGRAELDPTQPLGYLGVSQGSTHGLGLLAFAPEIHAAALCVGAGRFSATLAYQSPQALFQAISSVYPTITQGDFYAGIALVQMLFDRQDSLNLARFIYAQPLELGSAARASVLLTEGLGDTLVPSYATRAAASQLGIPQLLPHAEDVPFLASAAAPLRGNVTQTSSAALFQFVPAGYVGAMVTPGCMAGAEVEGHYCAQTALEALRQRIHFFQTALVGVPEIIEP
jgi:hypothetical protein